MQIDPFAQDPLGFAQPLGQRPNPHLPRIMQGHPLAPLLAFFFVFKGSRCFDLVRGDTALSSGTVTLIDTPYGRKFQMGASPSTVGGFKTKGADTLYYNRSPTAFSLACGAWNQGTITNPASRNVFAYWADTSLEANGLEVGLALGAGHMAAYTQITGASSSGTNPAAAPTPDGNATGVAMSVAGSYTAGALRIAYQNSGPTGSQAVQTGSTAVTKSVSNLGQIFIGDQFANAATGRALIWCAGWFKAFSAAEITLAVNGAGGPPRGLIANGGGVFPGNANQ